MKDNYCNKATVAHSKLREISKIIENKILKNLSVVDYVMLQH